VSYKDLLVVLYSEAIARKRIAFAAVLAERFSAHLIGLYPLPTRKRRGISGITIRRWGGATRSVLRSVTVPVLMSH
jgi:hypothetical protein